MLLRDLREQDGWIYSSWELTYPTGWEGILKAAETIYEYYTGCAPRRTSLPSRKSGISQCAEYPPYLTFR